ncbi:MAG: class I SAM-dependent methyltransferase [Longicatena sp.]|nr:class I SAM-dependent methyltransferase [Longicatena sp.]
MKNESKTLYIPLYGKAYVSQKGIILNDPSAENIWNQEGFELKGKAKSKWLAYYMAMRSATMDKFVKNKLQSDSCILHLGCGLDSRVKRLSLNHPWYDVDFKEVIEVRQKYFSEDHNCHMLAGDVSKPEFLTSIPYHQHGIIILEGLTMYLSKDILNQLFEALSKHFDTLDIILDTYSTFALKMSKKRNPINSVEAIATFGMDDGTILETAFIKLQTQMNLCQEDQIQQLSKSEQVIFKSIYTNKMTNKLYQIYTYTKTK